MASQLAPSQATRLLCSLSFVSCSQRTAEIISAQFPEPVVFSENSRSKVDASNPEPGNFIRYDVWIYCMNVLLGIYNCFESSWGIRASERQSSIPYTALLSVCPVGSIASTEDPFSANSRCRSLARAFLHILFIFPGDNAHEEIVYKVQAAYGLVTGKNVGAGLDATEGILEIYLF